MPASGDDDSPMANRGWRPRSISATRSPMRRATIARIDPPNPEPTIARSTSGTRTLHRRRHLLLAIHARETRGAIARTGTVEQPLDVPQISEEAHPPGIGKTFLHHPLEIAKPKLRPGRGGQDVDCAVASANGNHAADAGAAGASRAHRCQRPLGGLAMRHEGRIEEHEHAQRDRMT